MSQSRNKQIDPNAWIQTFLLWWIVESAGEEDRVIGQQHKVSWCEMSQSDKVIVVNTSSVFRVYERAVEQNVDKKKVSFNI